jgi:hypothetical protein
LRSDQVPLLLEQLATTEVGCGVAALIRITHDRCGSGRPRTPVGTAVHGDRRVVPVVRAAIVAVRRRVVAGCHYDDVIELGCRRRLDVRLRRPRGTRSDTAPPGGIPGDDQDQREPECAEEHPPARDRCAGSMDRLGPVERLGPVDRLGSVDRLGPVDRLGSVDRLGPVDRLPHTGPRRIRSPAVRPVRRPPSSRLYLVSRHLSRAADEACPGQDGNGLWPDDAIGH